MSAGEALASVIALSALYSVLMVVEFGLLLKFIRAGAEPFEEPPDPTLGGDDDDRDRPMAFAY